jgi:hypothetical protein
MKCNAALFYKDAKRKGSGEPYKKIHKVVPLGTNYYGLPKYEDAEEICDGRILVNIEAVDEPDWGGTYATLVVEYKCEKCGNILFPHLPNKYELKDYMQKHVDELEDK